MASVAGRTCVTPVDLSGATGSGLFHESGALLLPGLACRGGLISESHGERYFDKNMFNFSNETHVLTIYHLLWL